MPVGINKQAEVMPLNNCISVEVFLPLLQKKKDRFTSPYSI